MVCLEHLLPQQIANPLQKRERLEEDKCHGRYQSGQYNTQVQAQNAIWPPARNGLPGNTELEKKVLWLEGLNGAAWMDAADKATVFIKKKNL